MPPGKSALSILLFPQQYWRSSSSYSGIGDNPIPSSIQWYHPLIPPTPLQTLSSLILLRRVRRCGFSIISYFSLITTALPFLFFSIFFVFAVVIVFAIVFIFLFTLLSEISNVTTIIFSSNLLEFVSCLRFVSRSFFSGMNVNFSLILLFPMITQDSLPWMSNLYFFHTDSFVSDMSSISTGYVISRMYILVPFLHVPKNPRNKVLLEATLQVIFHCK